MVEENMTGLILFAHGSPDPRWRAPFEKIERELQQLYGVKRVRLAYLEFSPPNLETVVQQFENDGYSKLKLFPLFMSAGGHVSGDIPRIAEKVMSARSHLKLEIMPALGENPEFLNIIMQIAASYIE